VLVATLGKQMCEEKLKMCNELWENKVKAEFIYSVDPKP